MGAATTQFLASVRETRQQLALSQHRDGSIARCIARLEDLEQQLQRLPRVTILGEFNSGKTSLANLLLGACVLPTSVITNTRVPVVLRYSATAAIFAVTQHGRHPINTTAGIEALGDVPLRVEVHLPVDALRHFDILDTPPDFDRALAGAPGQVLLWCTVATRAWTDSERRAWSSLPACSRDNALLVATHKDGLRCAEDVEKVGQRLHTLAGPMFQDVIFVTADEGTLADAAAFEATGADELRERIGKLAAAISDRRRRKAATIARRLVRRTLQAMATADLGPGATALLVKWKQAAAKVCAGADADNAHAVAGKLLKAYAEFTEVTVTSWLNERSQSGSRKKPPILRHLDLGQLLTLSWRPADAAGEQFVRDLADDLTAALRIELVETTLKSPAPRGLYRKAQAALLTLAAAAAATNDSREDDAEGPGHGHTALVPPPLPTMQLEPPPLPASFVAPKMPASLTTRSGADQDMIRARAS